MWTAPGLDAQDPGNKISAMSVALPTDVEDPLERLQTVPGLTYLHRRGGLEDVFLKLTGRELRD